MFLASTRGGDARTYPMDFGALEPASIAEPPTATPPSPANQLR